jgi:hypothetical protein
MPTTARTANAAKTSVVKTAAILTRRLTTSELTDGLLFLSLSISSFYRLLPAAVTSIPLSSLIISQHKKNGEGKKKEERRKRTTVVSSLSLSLPFSTLTGADSRRSLHHIFL